MQLGFVTAILPEFTLDEIFAFAADEGFGCVELMCWPPGGADRRYAGVTHLDITNVTDALVAEVRELVVAHCTRHESIAPAELRDELGASRRLAQGLLERLDADGVTRRVGDRRVLRRRGAS